MATAVLTPTNRVWLEYTAFAVVQHTNNTGIIGDYKRGVTGWNQETYLKFDATSIPSGSTVTNVSLQITCNTKGGQVLPAAMNVNDQNYTIPDPAQPCKWNDFGNGTPWTVVLTTINSGTSTGTYTYPSTAPFVARVQSWVDGSVAASRSIVLDANFGAVGSFLSIDAAQLTVTYDPPNIIRNIYSINNEVLPMNLRKDTAHTLVVGPFISDTDFKTTQTGLTLTASDFRISKNGGTVSTPTLTSASHAYDGNYYCTFPTGTFDTAGRLDFVVSKSGSLKFKISCIVYPATVYDALLSTGILPVNVTQVSGSSQTISTQAQVQQVIDKLPVGYIAEQTTMLQVQSDTQAINAVMPAGQVMAQSDLASIASATDMQTVVNALPVTGLIAGNDLLVDVDNEIDAIQAQMPVAGQVADQASIEAILAVLPPDQIVGLGDLGAVTLDASTDNFDVVAHALKTYDATALSPVAGSIYQTIITPLSNIDSQLPAGGAEIASGVQVEETAQNTRYIMKNRMVKNGDGTITFYEDDDTTPAFSVSHTETERMPL